VNSPKSLSLAFHFSCLCCVVQVQPKDCKMFQFDPHGLGDNWFEEGVVVGNGNKTSFWLDKWVGDIPLSERIPRLYSLSNQKEGKLG